MQNDFGGFYDGQNARSEGYTPKKAQKVDPSQMQKPAPMPETSSPEMSEMESFSFEMESSPVVPKVMPMYQPQMAPMPKKETTFAYTEVEKKETNVQIDAVMYKTHPMHQCLNICEFIKDCMLHCECTIQVLMWQPDSARRRRQIALLQDCCEVSALTTRFVARKSPLMKTALLYCAKVCRLTAEESMRFNDTPSRTSARMCLHCAEVCERFAEGYAWS